MHMVNKLPHFLFSSKILFLIIFAIITFYGGIFFTLKLPAYAQLSGCANINIGNGGNASPPAQCDSGGSGLAHWPFAKKDPGWYRRIDQGWDFQPSSPQVVYAVASGKVFKANADPCGFGDYYPYETLDSPVVIKSNGHKYTTIYYGHVHIADGTHGTPVVHDGEHIDAGKPIAYTYVDPLSGPCHPAWPAPWLEIGFGDNVPAAHGQAGATVQGLDMEEFLAGTRKVYQ